MITATQYEQQLESVPAHITTLTTADITNFTARNVPKFLRQASGLYVYNIHGLIKRNYQFDHSGFKKTTGLNTLVLVDGRRIHNPGLSGTN